MSLASTQPAVKQRESALAAVDRALSLQGVALDRNIGLDLLERAVCLTMFGFFAGRMLAAFNVTMDVALPLLVVSEFLPLLLITFRKWNKNHAMSLNPFDWMLAFIGANTPFMAVASEPGTFVPQEFCSVVLLTGLFVQISAKVVLWRSFGIVPAVREVKVAGPYRFVRHPMYAGYTIVHIGFLLAFPSLWNLGVYSCALLVQIARLLREEQVLNIDPAYREFSKRVRYRLLPGVF